MNKNNRNNEQIYGRNDMIMLDPNNKIYGSLGIADNYVMKTEEGTRLILSNPKLGRFGDVLTEFNIYGRSEQFSTTGAQLFNENIEIKSRGVTVKINGSTATFVGTVSDESNSRVNYQKKIKLKPGKYTASSSNKKIVADFEVKKANDKIRYSSHIEIDGTEEVRIRALFGLRPSAKGDIINETTNIMLNDGDIALPYEPYTGGKPSPSPDYPQEIKSVVNPIVKVTNEDGLKVQSVTFNNITLNAIPVTSGGNVTINGQQYIADYIDFKQGKFVKIVNSLILDGDKLKFVANSTNIYWNLPQQSAVKPIGYQILSNYFKIGVFFSNEYSNFIYTTQENMVGLFETVDELNDFIVKKYRENDPVVLYYGMQEPIETELTLEQIEQYKKLSTKAPTTIVENNYNTWMKATYKSTESV